MHVLNLGRCCQLTNFNCCNCILSSANVKGLVQMHKQPDLNSICEKTGDRSYNYDNTYVTIS